MKSVWLRYASDSSTMVSALVSIWDRIGWEMMLEVHHGDIFLCKEEIADSYKYREFTSDEDNYEDGSGPYITYGTTKRFKPTKQEKIVYEGKSRNFIQRSNLLLDYLLEKQQECLFWNKGKRIEFTPKDVIEWILGFHPEFLKLSRAWAIILNDVLKTMEGAEYISITKISSDMYGFRILPKFYTIPKIEEAQNPIHDINFPVSIDETKQTIKIGLNAYSNFEQIFTMRKHKDTYTNSQIKAGVWLIYAIVKVWVKKEIGCKSLLSYYKIFREDWNHWLFAKRGVKKSTITKTDCDSANHILGRCWIKTRIKLIKKEEKIIISELK